jgi:hypothetical protein
MKNKIILSCIIAVSITTLCFFSCQKKHDSAVTTNTTKSPSQGARLIDSFGINHNNTLAYCFTQFSNLPAHSVSQSASIADAANYCAAYLSSVNMDGTQFTQTQILNFYSQAGFNATYAEGWATNYDMAVTGLVSNFSGLQARLIHTLFSALNNAPDYASLSDSLNNVLDSAAYLSSTQQTLMTAYVSVEESSYAYWTANYSSWQSLVSTIGAKTTMEPHLKAAIGGDIGGAINGALTGATFAGVGALPGAMLGASFGSAGALLWSLF